MRSLVPLALIVCLATPAVARDRGDAWRRDPSPRVVDLRVADHRDPLDELASRADGLHAALDAELARIEQLAASGDRWALDGIRESAGRARQLRQDLARVERRLVEVARDRHAQQSPPIVVVPPAPQAMAGPDFQALIGELDRHAFSDDKLAVLRSVAPHVLFHVDQVKAVMDAFSFGSDKVEAAAMLFPRTVDRERWYLVYSSLTFSSDKDELRRRTG